MSILRTIKCDLCDEQETEKDNGTGWPGWCILQGISLKNPENVETYTYEHFNTTLCPSHTTRLNALITEHLEGK